MKCYKCNNVLSPDWDICPKCGSDLSVYKKIVYASNQYYNLGLVKAKTRDLTGAIEYLMLSLQLNKRNIDARNLLGLVYYEMGEAALAIKEWMISKNFQYRGNIAEDYIQDIKGNAQVLEDMENSTRKYNQALKNARTGARELAAVQLKKVIAVNQRMVKAYQLLVLLYIQDKRYDQAREIVKQCLEVDKGNKRALSYMEELGRLGQAREVTSNIRDNIKEQVIAPVQFRDYGSYLGSAVCILLGAIIALGILSYIIIPAKEREFTQKGLDNVSGYEQSMQDLNVQLGEKDQTIAALQQNISDLEAQKDELAKNPDQDNSHAELEAYDTLLAASQAYFRSNWMKVYELFPKIDAKKVQDTTYQAAYESLKTSYYTDLGPNLIKAGDKLVEGKDYSNAVQYYATAIKLDENQPGAIFGIAQAYENIDQKTSKDYYGLTISKFSGTEWAEKAEKRLKELGW